LAIGPLDDHAFYFLRYLRAASISFSARSSAYPFDKQTFGIL